MVLKIVRAVLKRDRGREWERDIRRLKRRREEIANRKGTVEVYGFRWVGLNSLIAGMMISVCERVAEKQTRRGLIMFCRTLHSGVVFMRFLCPSVMHLRSAAHS